MSTEAERLFTEGLISGKPRRQCLVRSLTIHLSKRLVEAEGNEMMAPGGHRIKREGTPEERGFTLVGAFSRALCDIGVHC